MPGTSSKPRRRFAPNRWDSLEDRRLLAVSIKIDYTYDTNGFFNPAERRAALETAANTLGSVLNDSLLAITPGGGNTWTAVFDNPATGGEVTRDNMIVPANTILVYAGGRSLGGNTIGFGGPGGYSAGGSQAFLDLVKARGQTGALNDANATDLGPWGGAITFDTGTNWYFGLDGTKIGSRTDFFTTALHELTHLIGFGTSASWERLVSSAGRFLGARSTARFGSNVPVSPDGGHWNDGTMDKTFETSMDTTQLNGTRKLTTQLDYAGLADIGWQVGLSNATFAGAFSVAVPTSGSLSLTNQSIASAADYKLYKLSGTAGQSLTIQTSSFGGSNLDTLIRLFDAAGTEIGRANSGVFDTLTKTLPTTGSYYIGISSVANGSYVVGDGLNQLMAGATGAYTLTLSAPGGTGGGGGGGGGGTTGIDAVGVYNPGTGTFRLKTTNSGGNADISPFAFGVANSRAIVGDWNADGVYTVGVFNTNNAVFSLRNSNTAGAADAGTFQFGGANWIPVAGDWNGDGRTTIGVYNPGTSTFYLRNSNNSGAPDAGTIQFGAPGWLPVVGDWNGDGKTTIGVYNPNTSVFYLRNSNTPGAPDAGTIQFGNKNWRPISGDYDGNGTSTIGAYNPGTSTFYLRNSNTPGAADAGTFFFGPTNQQPLLGRFKAGVTASKVRGASLATVDSTSRVVGPTADLAGVNSGLFSLGNATASASPKKKAATVSERTISRLAVDLLASAHQSV